MCEPTQTVCTFLRLPVCMHTQALVNIGRNDIHELNTHAYNKCTNNYVRKVFRRAENTLNYKVNRSSVDEVIELHTTLLFI